MTRSPSVPGGSDGVSLLGVAGVAGVVGVVGLVGAAGASLWESASALSIEKPFSMPSVSHDVQGLAAVRRGAERDDVVAGDLRADEPLERRVERRALRGGRGGLAARLTGRDRKRRGVRATDDETGEAARPVEVIAEARSAG